MDLEYRAVGKVPIIGNSKTIYTHMKASELTHIIKQIVAEEIRKELPNAIAEVFANVMGQNQQITERVAPRHAPRVSRSPVQPEPQDEELTMKQSLREMFAGTPVMRPKTQSTEPRKFAKDPKINEILNQTRPFSAQERTGASLGMAAMMAAAQDMPMAMPMASPAMPLMEADTDEPAFLRNVPSMMPSHHAASIAAPSSQTELMRDDHVPLSDLPEGVSVHDVKQYAPPVVAEALTRDYSQFMKLVDKKKGKV